MEEDLQNAVEAVVSDIDKTIMRPKQKAAYRCCSQCCEDDSRPSPEVQSCLEECLAPLGWANETVNRELMALQNRLQNCALHCQQRAQDELQASQGREQQQQPPQQRRPPDSGTFERLKQRAEACMQTCVREQLAGLPHMVHRIKLDAESIR